MARGGAQSRLPAGEQDLSPEETALLADMQQDDGAGLPEPAAAPEPAPAAPETEPSPPAAAADRPRQDTVPHAALHEEREARKRAEADLSAERHRMQMLEERTNLILQRFAQQPVAEPPKPAETPIPDVATDPVGFIVGTQRAQQERMDAMQRERDQRAQIDQTAQIVGAIQQRATAMEHAYIQQKPDYPQAVSMLMGQRHRELEAVGYRDAAQRQLMIQQEGLQLAAMALQNGRNPAEVLYELANQRGYAAAPVATAPAAVNGAAEPPAQEPPASGAPAAADRINQISRGQQQARGIGNARGAAPAALTAQRLLEMNEREFAQMLETQEGMDLLGA